ncbi:MAG: elongation factor P maturation arginine rhamnosyltransferase EarP [Treponema sp.]|nr:elongation factor P maturation arginine rhamnosyltransferase EarP [Treponema sp.]
MLSTHSADLTILCKVVDNFGDIGFVYRLAKNLVQLNPQREIRVAVDNLAAFNKIESRVDPALAEQVLEVACADSLLVQEGADKAGKEGKPKTAAEIESESKPKSAGRLRIFDATNAAVCACEWTKKPARVILECFQCGRPDWLEALLFDGVTRALIINIDYLTAEDYAEEFHRLKSGTRSPLVRKVNFMPGFTAKTGGLILDAAAESARKAMTLCAANESKPKSAPATENGFITKTAGPQILMFSYPKDFAPIIRAILRWNKAAQVNLAQGAGKESFLAANENCLQDSCKPKTAGGLFVRELPFLSQEEWDKNLYAQDILFVRGEDSLSRACLSGKPFVWQAYLQDDNYQLVKVRALLERMRLHFAPEDFAALENFWLLYNGAESSGKPKTAGAAMEEACYGFLERSDKMKAGFEAFARSLFEQGNFAEKLDEFVSSQEL